MAGRDPTRRLESGQGSGAEPSRPETGSVARPSMLNLAAGFFLLFLNILLVPHMLRAFGLESYGILTITWMVLGNLGWLDLGLSNATTRYVALELSRGEPGRAAQWACTALVLQVAVGILAALGLWLSAPRIVAFLHVSPTAESTIVWTLRAFAWSIPIDLAAGSLNGVLEAARQFAWSNGIAVATALGAYASYAAGILAGGDLRVVTWSMLSSKVLQTAMLARRAHRIIPGLSLTNLVRVCRRDSLGHNLGFMGFGGWVTLNVAVGSWLFLYDRWVISALGGAAALPFYSIPFGLLQRLQVIPNSAGRALFPALTALAARAAWRDVTHVLVRAHQALIVAIVGAVFVVMVWGHAALRIWIDEAFAARAARPLQILTVGFGFALLAPIAGVLLYGAGRPDVLAKLYLAELPLNLVAVTLLTRHFGIEGAAFSFLLRALIETAVVWWLVGRVLPVPITEFLRKLSWRLAIVVGPLLAGAAAIRPTGLDPFAVVGTLTCLAASGIAALYLLFNHDERRRLLRAVWGARA